MKNIKNLQQCHGKLQDVVMLRCDSPTCGQIQFGAEPNSLCPDCGKGNLQIVKS